MLTPIHKKTLIALWSLTRNEPKSNRPAQGRPRGVFSCMQIADEAMEQWAAYNAALRRLRNYEDYVRNWKCGSFWYLTKKGKDFVRTSEFQNMVFEHQLKRIGDSISF